ncbi:MAG: DUF4271 domain-containing protein [Bacteroidales bacterium]|nr:DUF4271 domain-containing protein [Bacteroidales bacterium]
MELQIVNTRGNSSLAQELPDSLGVISFQELQRSPQHLSFPLQSPAHETTLVDTILTLDTTVTQHEYNGTIKSAEPTKTDCSPIRVPFTRTYSYNPDFTLNLFDQQGVIDMNQRNFGAHPTFSQDFKDKVFTINYKKINDTSNNWMFWLILGSVALLCVARMRYRKQFDLLLSSIFHYNFSLKTIRNASESNKQLSAVLQILFVFNTSLFTYQTAHYFNPQYIPGLKSIALVCIGAVFLFLIYSIKSLVLRGVGIVYMRSDYVHEYLFNVQLYNKALGIFLLPVILCFAFVQPHIISHHIIMTVGFILIGFFYLLRIIRGTLISIKSNISLFYVFLCFCILEFLPIVLLAKTAIIIVNSVSL